MLSPAGHLPRDHPPGRRAGSGPWLMTHRGPRGGAGCSAPRHVREGLRMSAGATRAPTPRPRPPAHPLRPGARVPARRAGRHHRAARSSTLTASVLHHAPRRAFWEPEWTPRRGRPRGHRAARTPPGPPCPRPPRGCQRASVGPSPLPGSPSHGPKER